MANKQEQAKKVYTTMVNTLRKKDWNFDEREEDLTIVSGYQGDDIPINFIIKIDADREVISFLSPLPFKARQEKRVDVALAVSVANYGMVNGSFDYDLNDGEIRFRLATSYCGCEIGEDFFMDMMATALLTTDRYNDRFMNLDKGVISLQDFINQDK